MEIICWKSWSPTDTLPYINGSHHVDSLHLVGKRASNTVTALGTQYLSISESSALKVSPMPFDWLLFKDTQLGLGSGNPGL